MKGGLSGMIEAGTSVEGYRVVRMIGRGGMGVVYEAVQTSLNRPVALKVLRPELAQDPGFVERFRREGRLQASIEHPNVLDVYEVGESEQGLFLSMRLVPGQTLLDLLRDGELDADRSLNLLDQVTGALDAAHAATLVHRDVKPQNVLVDDDDKAYLADFGLTREGSETTAAAGSSRTMLGSVAYVAPEIVRGEEPTPASDRYSLGATLFQCLTGDVVFPRGSDAAVLYAHAAEPPPGVHERRPELPAELDEVLAAALAKDPDTRPETAQSIIAAAREALGEDSKRFGPPPPVGPDSPAALSAFPPPPDSNGSKGSDSPTGKGLTIAGLVALVLAGAALIAATTMSSDDQDATSGEVPVAAVPAGGTALGSELAVPDRSVDCRGQADDDAAESASKAAPESLSCSIVQSELPGATLLVPSDGVITGWNVRGAQGDLALDVIRPRGGDTLRAVRSQWEFASNVGPTHFETRLPVEGGDQIGIELGTGASIGVSDAEGATTQRWFNPTGGAYGDPDKGPGTGLDSEVALRADFVPDEVVEPPRHLVGAAAANAPDGLVRESEPLKVGSLDEPLKIELSEVGDSVVVDVLSEGRRTLRVFLPDLVPGGVPIQLETVRYAGQPFGEVDVWWVNPNTGRSIFHFLALGKGHIEFAG